MIFDLLASSRKEVHSSLLLWSAKERMFSSEKDDVDLRRLGLAVIYAHSWNRVTEQPSWKESTLFSLSTLFITAEESDVGIPHSRVYNVSPSDGEVFLVVGSYHAIGARSVE